MSRSETVKRIFINEERKLAYKACQKLHYQRHIGYQNVHIVRCIYATEWKWLCAEGIVLCWNHHSTYRSVSAALFRSLPHFRVFDLKIKLKSHLNTTAHNKFVKWEKFTTKWPGGNELLFVCVLRPKINQLIIRNLQTNQFPSY